MNRQLQPESGRIENAKDDRRRFEDLPPVAQRALKEAEQRRIAKEQHPAPKREVGGRGGKDPARYGDWEIDGRAIDF